MWARLLDFAKHLLCPTDEKVSGLNPDRVTRKLAFIAGFFYAPHFIIQYFPKYFFEKNYKSPKL